MGTPLIVERDPLPDAGASLTAAGPSVEVLHIIDLNWLPVQLLAALILIGTMFCAVHQQR